MWSMLGYGKENILRLKNILMIFTPCKKALTGRAGRLVWNFLSQPGVQWLRGGPD